MGELGNPRHETFAKLTAAGQKRADAYLGSGYHANSRNVATKRGVALYARPELKARVEELKEGIRQGAIAAVQMDREWVLRGLKENYSRAMQEKAVRDRQGNETGEFKYDGSVANRALELAGKELGMFADRLITQNLDSELEGMSPEEVQALVKSLVLDCGMRFVEMTDDDTRDFILRNAERVGLIVAAAPTH
jgi:hypothetical protein